LDLIPPGSVKSFQINGKEVMVINNNGQLFCLQARCTHAGAPLAEGTIEDDILTCPWHGSRFRITNGEVIKGPAEKPLQVYKNIITDNFLYIEL
jgi:nitrite reductase/ring-hydroxylating ferredoxin subunit